MSYNWIEQYNSNERASRQSIYHPMEQEESYWEEDLTCMDFLQPQVLLPRAVSEASLSYMAPAYYDETSFLDDVDFYEELLTANDAEDWDDIYDYVSKTDSIDDDEDDVYELFLSSPSSRSMSQMVIDMICNRTSPAPEESFPARPRFYINLLGSTPYGTMNYYCNDQYY